MCYRIGGNLHRKKLLWIGRFSWGRLLWIAHWCCQIMWRPKISWRRLLWIATKPWNLQKFAPSKVSRYIYNIWFLSCLADPWGWVSSGILRDGPWVCPCLLDAARLQIPPPTHHWKRWYTYECYLCPSSFPHVCCKIYIACCIYAGEEETQAAFRKHFEEQLGLYQQQVIT